jgi:glutamate-1-semialdehyde 2,1-aminomutase
MPVQTKNLMHTTKFNPEQRERSVRAKTAGSLARFERSKKSLAGGVSSGLRRSARPYPLFFTRGAGARVVDVDGNSYFDYGLAWGPLILGHAPEEVAHAIEQQVRHGLTFGAQHDLEYEVAEKLVSVLPCADAVCFSNSGTEIVQLALRLSRAATGREEFLKFEGHYHGWADDVLCSYHPSLTEIAKADGTAIPVGAGQRPQQDTVIAQWNDRESVEAAFSGYGADLAAVICEPMLCNSGCIAPVPGFLEFLREITERHGTLLIFDEVITGFRLALGGAQERYQVTPDLAVYAKAIGAGAALSAMAGRQRVMDLIANGTVVHAGTLNGNPMALAAGKACLDVLSSNGGAVYACLRSRGERLRTGIESVLNLHAGPVVTQGEGAVFQVQFMAQPARNYRDTLAADKQAYSDFALALLDEGVLVLPDGRWYVSVAHTDADIDATLAAVKRAVAQA